MQNSWGYEARPSQASKSIKNTVGTPGFAKPCVPKKFLVFFEAWEGLASYPREVHVIDDAKTPGIGG
jgi:hypothetical protein